MEPDNQRQHLLRRLPAVDRLLEHIGDVGLPHAVLTDAIRCVLDDCRRKILSADAPVEPHRLQPHVLAQQALALARKAMRPRLRPVFNATGVVVHTNLGRSRLAEQALARVQAVAAGYSNLEYDLEAGRRGSRHSIVEELICRLTGAEAALAVNNNAGAVLIGLDTLARGKEVVISRGELVEIGGSFRIPDVMAKSGAVLREVGTTNRTHLHDYSRAIGPQTGLLFKAHTSNFAVVGFTRSVPLEQLVQLGRRHGIAVMEDLGSGSLIDLSRYGLMKEPTVQESVAAGADLVTFSGDKLLGGPQAGLMVGRGELIEAIKANPLARALRLDKMTLAALEATLRLYLDPQKAVAEIPTLRCLCAQPAELEARARRLAEAIAQADIAGLRVEPVQGQSRPGGGALPLQTLPTSCLALSHEGLSASRMDRLLRQAEPPVVARIENDRLILDPRTVEEDEIQPLARALARALAADTPERNR